MGIHTSSEHPLLAASPDGLVEDPTETRDRQHGILGIKCPYSARTMTPQAASGKLNRFCCSLVAGQVTLKQTHEYYYQIQGQMAIANKPWCDFCVWTPLGVTVERINRDQNFWQQKMFPNCKRVTYPFYC